MAYYPFQYYRLYLATEDQHYHDLARMLLHNTKQTIDWDGSLGYAHPGLQTEAMTVSLRRGRSVRLWLPWLTVATIQPLVQLQHCFGSREIDEIEKLSWADKKERDAKFAACRGFPNVPDVPAADARPMVYLDDIDEHECSVGHGTLGKWGSHGYGPAHIEVQGHRASHALSTHPPPYGSAYVAYRLEGRYSRFTAAAAISDAAQQPSESALVFKVFGDGRLLWQSRPIQQNGASQDCDVDIQDVDVLKLQVECNGGAVFAYAVWIEPQVTR